MCGHRMIIFKLSGCTSSNPSIFSNVRHEKAIKSMKILFILLLWCIIVQKSQTSSVEGPPQPLHPLATVFQQLVEACGVDARDKVCPGDDMVLKTGISMVNAYSALLMQDTAQEILHEVFYHIEPDSPLGMKISHILAVLSFSQGELGTAETYWDTLRTGDLLAHRSLAAQLIMTGTDDIALEVFNNYTTTIGARYLAMLDVNDINYTFAARSANATEEKEKGAGEVYDAAEMEAFNGGKNAVIPRENITSTEDLFMSYLYNEAGGTVRVRPPLADVLLASTLIETMTPSLQFQLGVGLAKMGLFDLSLKHVGVSATPWENPLYRLRARLSFPPVQSGVRALAQAVDSFEQQGEMLLLFREHGSSTELMQSICNSLNEAALALQALPLLHLAGYSSPRHNFVIGHSPVALPVLLSEVLQNMCPPLAPDDMDPLPLVDRESSDQVLTNMETEVDAKGVKDSNEASEKFPPLRIGFLSGSFDGQPGHTVAGLLESLSKKARRKVILTALSFPTPRDNTTDLMNKLFDNHVNLNPHNKTQAIERIRASEQDLLIFTDAGLDSRTFALAHERLVRYQALLWGWGGTLGIPSVDFYIVPEPLWRNAACATVDPHSFSGDHEMRIAAKPQELFAEQTLFLDGVPPLPSYMKSNLNPRVLASADSALSSNFLLPPKNSSHLYLIPCSVKQVHPEFDSALSILLQTDPQAVVVLAVPRTGRDSLPSTHFAVRHDLMHPTNPTAAVNKFRLRLRRLVSSAISRVRVLPPLERTVFEALQQRAGIILDPFPVGLHGPIIESLSRGIPVVSAPALQECTNRHADGIMEAFGVNPHSSPTSSGSTGDEDASETNSIFSPTTPEEYAVLAVQVQHDRALREKMLPTRSARDVMKSSRSQGEQLLDFAKALT